MLLWTLELGPDGKRSIFLHCQEVGIMHNFLLYYYDVSKVNKTEGREMQWASYDLWRNQTSLHFPQIPPWCSVFGEFDLLCPGSYKGSYTFTGPPYIHTWPPLWYRPDLQWHNRLDRQQGLWGPSRSVSLPTLSLPCSDSVSVFLGPYF